MESITIRNFGPIKTIDIEIKDINIYIGTLATGKSTVAKLVSVFKSGQLSNGNASIDYFRKLLANYNIDFNISKDMYIRYEYEDLYLETISSS